jgi:hypothetical protein
MRPLEGNEEFCNNPSESGLKTAADLIMWTGPDIPCLDLCSGDTVQKVIYDLAIILCDITDNVLDVTKLDYKCMLEDGACPPETLREALQLIINQHCSLDTSSGSGPASTLPIVNLPTCLHYKNTDGDTITSLRLDLYAKFLADTICKIIIDVKSLKSVVTNLTTQVNTLNATLTGGGGSAGGSGSTTTVTSKCLSAPTPGQVLPITTAFANLETAMCSYIDLLGTSQQWTTLIDNQCITVNTIIPGTTNTKYSSLPGWIQDPSSVVESMTNLWKVVCKLNETSTASASGSSSCFPAVPSLVYDPATQDVTWNSPAPSTYSQPVGYKIKVTNSTTGATVHQNNSIVGTTTSYDLTPYITDTTLTYKIELIAAYDCGDSSAGLAIVAPASSGGGGGGGTTTSAFKIKMEILGGVSSFDFYSDTLNTNPIISKATPFTVETIGCDCATATPPCAGGSKIDDGFGNDYLQDRVPTKKLPCTLETFPPFTDYPFGSDDVNAGINKELNPTEPQSEYYQFRVTLVDALTENNAANNTGKPIVIKIRTKRAYWKLDTFGVAKAGQSPAGWQEYVVNIVIPVNGIYSNYVKVYHNRGVDKDLNCRKYIQCAFCYLGAYEGTTEVDGVVKRPANLGTTLSSIGIVTSSFNAPALNLPTSCAGVL